MTDRHAIESPPFTDDEADDVDLLRILTWIGERKWFIASFTVIGAVIGLTIAFLLPHAFTARTTLLPPGAQQQTGSSAALATLGALGALPAGLGGKTPDELYVALLRSDTVLHSLDERFKLQQRYGFDSFEVLRKRISKYITVSSEKKSGVITVEVEDHEPAFAAALANAHVGEIARVLDRLAVSEAQQRRVFFEQQLNLTKERLIKAEQGLRAVQERSGVIVLDKQAEALIGGAAQLRSLIAEREVQLKVMKTGATEQNPEVMRMNSELAALRSELARLESSQPNREAAAGRGTDNVSALDIPVGRLPEAAVEFIRARREVKLQETLLENMIRQYEIAKLDEAKEGQVLQQIDKATPPDYRSWPPRFSIALGGTVAGLLVGIALVLMRNIVSLSHGSEDSRNSWLAVGRAWRLRG